MARTPKEFGVTLKVDVVDSMFGKVTPGGVVKIGEDFYDVVEVKQNGRIIDMIKREERVFLLVDLSRQLEHDEAVKAAGESGPGR